MAHIKRMVIHGFKSFARKTEVVFDDGINVVIGPNGSGKSCSYDTVVTLVDGTERKIGEIIEDQINKSEEIKHLDDGIYVEPSENIEIISLNKSTMKAEPKKISKFIKREGDNLFRLRTRSGRELDATGCHPIMCFKDGKVQSRKINEMDKGFFVAVPRKINLENNSENIDFSRLMGYIIGDGYIANDRIEFVNRDKEVLKDFEDLLLRFSKWGIRKRVSGDTVRIYSRDKELYEKIRGFYPKIDKKTITSQDKNIPNYFLNLGKESVSNLLAGLFDTDGSVRKDIGTIEFCTKNKDLARQMQSLLLRFNILSKIKKRICSAKNTELKKKREYYYLYIYGLDNLKRFYENINLRVEYKNENLRKLVGKNIVPNTNVDVLPKEVNLEIKKLVALLGIKMKNEKKKYPALGAYVENRCCPSRQMVKNYLTLFNERFSVLRNKFESLNLEQVELISFMDSMALSTRYISKEIGLHPTIIRNQWAKGRFNAREENLSNFKECLSKIYISRIAEIGRIINLLTNLTNSDIYWDEIVSIEKLGKPEYVYDLTIEENHNFIANNIFAHNSNVSDALCFALGRLSIKSMRAAKASNLIFMGGKYDKPAKEAVVELVFSNENRDFNLSTKEVSLKRIVRRNGQSIYKINGETKTRGEIVELLAHAGIDPHGFNMVLQGQIQAIVKMHSEERRKIIEEVAGISIYESRKEKSLKELEKTDEKLKEISAVLRERTSYLNNLEKEKRQAERFKELESTVKRCKAGIITKKLEGKRKELENINKSISEKEEQKNKLKEKTKEVEEKINSIGEKINEINKSIKDSTGLEQEKLHDDISNLRALIEGLRVRKENFESRKEEVQKRIDELEKGIPDLESEIEGLRRESPLMAKKAEELKKKKQELAEIEEEKKKVLSVKSEIQSLRERIKDKAEQVTRADRDSENLVKQIEELSQGMKYKDGETAKGKLEEFISEIKKIEEKQEKLLEEKSENEKIIAVSEIEIKRAEESKKNVQDIDTCPLCKSELTEEHVDHVILDSQNKIKEFTDKKTKALENLEEIKKEQIDLKDRINKGKEEVRKIEYEIQKHKSIREKKEELKKEVSEKEELNKNHEELEKRLKNLEERDIGSGRIEEKYERKMMEIEEISSRTDEDLDTVLLYKERELENTKGIIKRSKSDLNELKEQTIEITKNLEEKEGNLEEKEKQEEELNKKFNKMFEERDALQKEIQEKNYLMSEKQGEIRQVEEQVNYLKIGKAKMDAESESLEIEIKEFEGIEILEGSINYLQERMQKAQGNLQGIGSINMRALEVYEQVKGEYDRVKDKTDTLEKEKEEILKIIEEIDKKKKRTFMKTFKSINDIFTENFAKLSKKGQAYLEIENKEDIFEGGVNIVVKLAKGKYFDVTSLSGGEQTLVALSLLFAIQEYKPYHFYIFDEIDAALDKRNSERLAGLLKQYMKAGQYIVVTHNDAIIMESNLLYGVSMHDGVSKILSLKMDEENSLENNKE